MGWRDTVRSGRALRTVLGLHIEGCGTLFRTGPLYNADGLVDAPKPEGLSEDLYYTTEDSLLVEGGLSQLSSSWDLEAGVAIGGSCTFQIAATDAVRELFAQDDPDIQGTILSADVGFDSADTEYDRYQIQVRSTDGFNDPAVTGNWEYVHVGRECIAYNDMDTDVFGDDTSDNMIRGMWWWRSESKLSREALANQDNWRERVPVTERQTEWYGRRVTLIAWLCDENGYMLDDDYRGENEVEIWSGFISQVAPSRDNWSVYEISCTDLTDALRQDIGYDAITGVAGKGNWQRLYTYFEEDERPVRRVRVTRNGTRILNIGNPTIRVGGTGDEISGRHSIQGYLDAVAATLEYRINLGLSAASSTAEVVVAMDRGYYEDAELGSPTPGTRLAIYNPTLDGTLLIEIWFRSRSVAARIIGMGGRKEFNFDGIDDENAIIYYGETNADEVITESDTRISVFPDQDVANLPEPPAPGHAVLEDTDGNKEAIYYATATENEDYPGSYILGGVLRGLLGTTPRSFSYSSETEEASDGSSSGMPTIKFVRGWDSVSVLSIVGQMLLSTGTPGTYDDDLDVLRRDEAVALDPACVDASMFADDSVHPPFVTRSLLLDSKGTIESFVKDHALFSGFVLTPKILDDGSYRLTWVPLDVPLEHLPAVEYAMDLDGGILHDPQPSLEQRSVEVVTSMEIEVNYDPTSQEFLGTPYKVVNANKVAAYGKSSTMTLSVPGVLPAEALEGAIAAAERVLYLYGRRWYTITFAADTRGHELSAGDVILVTIPNMPNPYSPTVGLVEHPARVLDVSGSWFSPGEKEAVTVTCKLFPTFSGLAPSFTVEDYDAGPPVLLTVADNAWTSVNDKSPVTGEVGCKDYDFGPQVGDDPWEVWIFNLGDVENREAHTIEATATHGVYELDTALTLTWGVDTRMEFADWDDCNETQHKYVFIADEDGLLGGDDDAGKKWSP